MQPSDDAYIVSFQFDGPLSPEERQRVEARVSEAASQGTGAKLLIECASDVDVDLLSVRRHLGFLAPHLPTINGLAILGDDRMKSLVKLASMFLKCSVKRFSPPEKTRALRWLHEHEAQDGPG